MQAFGGNVVQSLGVNYCGLVIGANPGKQVGV